jgi:hypothetical protein
MLGINDLPAAWRSKADDYLRTAKAYQCRSHSETRGGLVKGAAVLKSCARELEELLAEVERMSPAQSNDS